jgi:hypothetical protein
MISNLFNIIFINFRLYFFIIIFLLNLNMCFDILFYSYLGRIFFYILSYKGDFYEKVTFKFI